MEKTKDFCHGWCNPNARKVGHWKRDHQSSVPTPHPHPKHINNSLKSMHLLLKGPAQLSLDSKIERKA